MKVLTTGYWPTPQQVQTAVQLPVTAQAAFEEFKMFYLNRHTGRQLTLQGNMGDAELNAVFYPKKREAENPDQPSTSDPAPVKERKHILAVSKTKSWPTRKNLFSAQHIKCAFLLHSINEKVGHLKSSLQKQVTKQLNQDQIDKIIFRYSRKRMQSSSDVNDSW